jgi:hypothetical protein
MNAGSQVAALALQDGELRRDPVDVAAVADDPDKGKLAVAVLRAGGNVEENGKDVGDTSTTSNAQDVRVGCQVAHGLLAVWALEDNR